MGKEFRLHGPQRSFQPGDLTGVPYRYAVEAEGSNDDWTVETEWKEGLSRPLDKVVERLQLLGFTLGAAEKELECICTLEFLEASKLTLEEMLNVMPLVNLARLRENYGMERLEFVDFFQEEVAPRLGFAESDPDRADFVAELLQSMADLSGYTILLLLAANPDAGDLPVTWHFKDHEESGWGQRSDYIRPLSSESKFLIVTEGSSDALILGHAFKLLMPQIEDFFHFVDMQEGYPFSGTGNLFLFVKGLISIGVQNTTIILFDNDAEGVFGYDRCSALRVPKNMRILKLPDLEAFRSMPTVGPGGEVRADINGRAAAIECYLDLGRSPQIRWTSFNPKTATYQGELQGKDRYKMEFLSQKELIPGYDYGRLRSVLESIVNACISIRSPLETRKYERLLERWS